MPTKRSRKTRTLTDLLLAWQQVMTEAGGKPGSSRKPPEPKPGTREAKLKSWQHLLFAMEENQPDLAYLDTYRAQLETLLRQARELLELQAGLTGLKQGATKQLSELIASGQRLATVLRLSVKQRYGNTADKLEDFGIEPYRKKVR
ncbi:MAG TPA: hypothetical protein VH394_13325 [Thermoanaerobaculia bacterium]|jgi:hypothetical protein|nr:hypothetical protein [Thermoanaerobaculia bacterium]